MEEIRRGRRFVTLIYFTYLEKCRYTIESVRRLPPFWNGGLLSFF